MIGIENVSRSELLDAVIDISLIVVFSIEILNDNLMCLKNKSEN